MQHSELQGPPAPQDQVLVEQSINSARVSFRFHSADAEGAALLSSMLRFIMHRADELGIVRRVPLPGWHLTLLITSSCLERVSREQLIQVILEMYSGMQAEVNAMRLSLRSRARAVAASFWQTLPTAPTTASQPSL
jgi:actin related protein 2/3 complex subunit 4